MPLEEKELDEKILLNKAATISETAIQQAFMALNLNGITPENAEQCYREIQKYALLMKTVSDGDMSKDELDKWL